MSRSRSQRMQMKLQGRPHIVYATGAAYLLSTDGFMLSVFVAMRPFAVTSICFNKYINAPATHCSGTCNGRCGLMNVIVLQCAVHQLHLWTWRYAEQRRHHSKRHRVASGKLQQMNNLYVETSLGLTTAYWSGFPDCVSEWITDGLIIYLRQRRRYMFSPARSSSSVCLSMCKITQKRVHGFG